MTARGTWRKTLNHTYRPSGASHFGRLSGASLYAILLSIPAYLSLGRVIGVLHGDRSEVRRPEPPGLPAAGTPAGLGRLCAGPRRLSAGDRRLLRCRRSAAAGRRIRLPAAARRGRVRGDAQGPGRRRRRSPSPGRARGAPGGLDVGREGLAGKPRPRPGARIDRRRAPGTPFRPDADPLPRRAYGRGAPGGAIQPGCRAGDDRRPAGVLLRVGGRAGPPRHRGRPGRRGR